MKKVPSSAALALTVVALAPQASAATLSIDSISTTTTSLTEVSNSFGFVQVSPSAGKIVGTGEFTATESSATLEIGIAGVFQMSIGEVFTLDYDFNLDVTGAGQLDWEITSWITLFGISGPSRAGGPLGAADSGDFTGSSSFASPFADITSPYTATLTVNWTGATAGDQMTVIIPNNSIDFAIAVPEPSTVMLGSLALLGLFRRRRA